MTDDESGDDMKLKKFG